MRGIIMYIPTCPHKYKYQLVDWCSKYFEESKTKFNKMSKKQLYAVFYSIAKKKGS